MSIGEPKMPTPEEQAKIEKGRTISDAELLEGGEFGPKLQHYIERIERIMPPGKCLDCVSDQYEYPSESYDAATKEIDDAISELFRSLDIEPREFFGSEKMRRDSCYNTRDVVEFVTDYISERKDEN